MEYDSTASRRAGGEGGLRYDRKGSGGSGRKEGREGKLRGEGELREFFDADSVLVPSSGSDLWISCRE